MQKSRNSNISSALKLIFALSIPAIVTNVTTPLLSMADVAIAGHIGSAEFIAAIAVGSSMFNMLYWLFGFLRMGTSGITAQAYGAANPTLMWLTLWRALLIAGSIGVTFLIFRNPLSSFILDIMDPDSGTRLLAQQYFDVCIWGAPAFLGSFVVTGWLLGMQNSSISMWVSIFMDVFNIALSLLLVFACSMGLNGVAMGTMCAQWLSFIIALVAAMTKFKPTRTSLNQIFQYSEIKRYFSVNTDIFLRTLCLVAVTVWFTRIGAEQGAVMLAVNALLMQLFTIFSFFMDGFAFAGEALCGRYHGASDTKSLQLVVRLLLWCGLIIAIIFTCMYTLAGDWFLTLLSSDMDVIRTAADYKLWGITIPLMGFMAFTWDGVFIGTTHTRSMLLAMASATVVYFLIYALLYPIIGNHGLWIAFLAYLLTRGVSLTFSARRFHFI